jgi:ketosteroid isomerase-like protein
LPGGIADVLGSPSSYWRKYSAGGACTKCRLAPRRLSPAFYLTRALDYPFGLTASGPDPHPSARRPHRARPRNKGYGRWGRSLLLALALAAAAGPAASEDPVAAVTALERDWAAAVVSKDLATLDALLHPDFRLVTAYAPGAGAVSKPIYLLRQEEAPEWAFTSMTPIAIIVDVRDGMALATVHMQVGWPDGVAMPPDFRFTDVWVRVDGAWQAISRFAQVRRATTDSL